MTKEYLLATELWFEFSLPSFWRPKTAYGIRCKRLRYSLPHDLQRTTTFRLLFENIISHAWKIMALKRYPLITKVMWVVLEAISKLVLRVSSEVPSKHLETIKALRLRRRGFICFVGVWNPSWITRTRFWYITSNFLGQIHAIQLHWQKLNHLCNWDRKQ